MLRRLGGSVCCSVQELENVVGAGIPKSHHDPQALTAALGDTWEENLFAIYCWGWGVLSTPNGAQDCLLAQGSFLAVFSTVTRLGIRTRFGPSASLLILSLWCRQAIF